MAKIDDAFLAYACDILADTNSGLSGMKIVEYCNSYAIDYNRKTPHGSYPFDAPNKRTALKENLRVFDAPEQFRIIKELCDLDGLVYVINNLHFITSLRRTTVSNPKL